VKRRCSCEEERRGALVLPALHFASKVSQLRLHDSRIDSIHPLHTVQLLGAFRFARSIPGPSTGAYRSPSFASRSNASNGRHLHLGQ
jgi:hypothetical protein